MIDVALVLYRSIHVSWPDVLAWAVLKLGAMPSATETGERSSSMASVRTVWLILPASHAFVDHDPCLRQRGLLLRVPAPMPLDFVLRSQI